LITAFVSFGIMLIFWSRLSG